MANAIVTPPLSLYLHIPWCVRKCPYCDFNSHAQNGDIPEAAYVDALLADLANDADLWDGRPLVSIFMGGGTPSLFSPQAYERLLAGINARIPFASDIEITLEANPGTVEQAKFQAYRSLGINRLSIGVQSFHPAHLEKLGRIHGQQEAIRAAESARLAGFDNFNLDLMHGLPNQSVAEALADLAQAVALSPTHLSWYQLTIEPNTVFYRHPPALPDDDTLWAIQEAGQQYLADQGFQQYEVSAYAQPGKMCRHNRQYWEFADYLALGAGAHGKITRNGAVWRYQKTRLPKDYLAAAHALSSEKKFTASAGFVRDEEVVFEFMLNALRLRDGVPLHYFSERTGLPLSQIENTVRALQADGLLQPSATQLACTVQGFNYLNQVLAHFLVDE